MAKVEGLKGKLQKDLLKSDFNVTKGVQQTLLRELILRIMAANFRVAENKKDNETLVRGDVLDVLSQIDYREKKPN